MTMDQSGGGTTPPPGQQPPPPPSQGWQSTPNQPGPPPPTGGQPGGGMPSWTSNISARDTIVGPGGLALADLPSRIFAYIIDAIILTVVAFIISGILGAVLVEVRPDPFFGIPIRGPSLVGQLIAVALTLVISAAYFIYMWTRMGGATIGMRFLKLSVRDASTGGPVSQGQAINRWIALGGPQVLSFLYLVLGLIGALIALAVLGYYIYLLVTTAQSPTRQGFHDTFAKTVVARVP